MGKYCVFEGVFEGGKCHTIFFSNAPDLLFIFEGFLLVKLKNSKTRDKRLSNKSQKTGCILQTVMVGEELAHAMTNK